MNGRKAIRGVSNLTKVMKEEMERISSAFVWQKKKNQEYNFRGKNKRIMKMCVNVDWDIMAERLGHHG